jgi:hypothetical protein
MQDMYGEAGYGRGQSRVPRKYSQDEVHNLNGRVLKFLKLKEV